MLIAAAVTTAWSFNVNTGHPTSSRAAVRAPKAAVAMAVSEMDGKVVPVERSRSTVPLTGDTLMAALKMRCDTSGAACSHHFRK